MKLILKLLPLLAFLSCQGIGKSTSNEPASDIVPTKVSHYRYYDLSKMKGIEPYSGDSCVTVTEWGDSITISVEKPKKYRITFGRYKDYWHSGGYFNMDKDWCKCGYAGPMRIDMFVRNDTLFKYRQDINSTLSDEIYGEIQVYTNDNLKAKWIEDKNCIVRTDQSEILGIINSIDKIEVPQEHDWHGNESLFNLIYNKQLYSITRTPNFVVLKHKVNSKSDSENDTCFFPEIQIWGTKEIGIREGEHSHEIE